MEQYLHRNGNWLSEDSGISVEEIRLEWDRWTEAA